ncbi:hypothetical protein M1L59_14525 [Acinetobacter schindleri]|uniref:hypothetical protein n=1 Tax=Acinetobacter schindleri TaxID=108981 RepID=UPI00200A7D9A|nr:hypothetical protein [Acinetobacter schindleri]MCK8641899.1 hypothetical protein [Acinetobacter schindleri]WQI99983.1 hypothetical protein Q7C11_02890 [Acinetobacter schindleri]
MDMIKFVIDEHTTDNGAHLIHNSTMGCENLPDPDAQILIGYFANYELAYKRARMNWPREKVTGCEKCCKA